MARFTAENASEMAKRSHEPTSARFNKPEPEPEPAPIPQPAVIPAPDYNASQLTRVRKQIENLYDMLAEEKNAQKIDRLASALARLNEIERQLANRPLPGSLKPERATAQTARRMPRQVPSTPPVVSDPPQSSS